MTTNPKLPNHLIRELMHTTRLRENGDAMVLLALSGKETFPVFKYIVENYACVTTRPDGVYVNILPQPLRFKDLTFSNKGSKRLVIRLTREVFVIKTPPKRLPLENIVKLDLLNFDKVFIPMLNSWTGLEVLKECYYDRKFVAEIAKGNISLTKLRKMELCLTFEECVELLSMTPVFPFSPDVAFDIAVAPDDFYFGLYAARDGFAKFDSLHKFAQVKHLAIQHRRNSVLLPTVLHLFSTIVNCFTGLETTKIDLTLRHDSLQTVYNYSELLHKWLSKVKFSAAVEFNLEELVKSAAVEDVDSIYEQLKAFGYKAASSGFNCVIKKEYGNVKLVHRIQHEVINEEVLLNVGPPVNIAEVLVEALDDAMEKEFGEDDDDSFEDDDDGVDYGEDDDDMSGLEDDYGEDDDD